MINHYLLFMNMAMNIFVKAFNKTADFRGKFLEFCVAGKEYEGKSGYTNYDMWLPKAEGKKYAFGAVEGGVVIPYDETRSS